MYALIVEPQPRRAALFADAAEAEGLHAALASTDDEARRILARRGRPDLCVLELTVATVDGFRLLAELRDHVPAVPAIVVSAYRELRETAWSRRATFQIAAVLSTNLDMDVVRHTMAAALKRSAPAAPLVSGDSRQTKARALRVAASRLSRAPSPSVALQSLLDGVREAFDLDTTMCAVQTGDRELLVAQSGARFGSGPDGELAIASYFLKVLSGEALVVADVLDHPAFIDHPLVTAGRLRGFAGFPLEATDGTVLGALCLLHTEPLELNVPDVNELHRLTRRISGEVEVLRAPRRSPDERAAFALAHFTKLVEQLEQPVALWRASGELMLANPSLACLLGRPAEELVRLDLDAVADALAALTDDAEFVERFRHRPAPPSVSHEEVEFSGEPRRCWRWSCKPIELPGGMGAFDSWLDITAERELAKAALTDALTGLANRRGGEVACRRELSRAVRTRAPLSFLVVDIDHFKRVNDENGHSVGDWVIRAVAGLLVKALRTTDVAVRWGGEEFLALLPDADLAAARVIAERFRAALEGAAVLPHLRVTASIGTAQWEAGERAEATIERADVALYAAKAAGRNCVR